MREIANMSDVEKALNDEKEKAETLIAVLSDSGFFKLYTICCLQAIKTIIEKLGKEKGMSPKDLADIIANNIKDVEE